MNFFLLRNALAKLPNRVRPSELGGQITASHSFGGLCQFEPTSRGAPGEEGPNLAHPNISHAHFKPCQQNDLAPGSSLGLLATRKPPCQLSTVFPVIPCRAWEGNIPICRADLAGRPREPSVVCAHLHPIMRAQSRIKRDSVGNHI